MESDLEWKSKADLDTAVVHRKIISPDEVDSLRLVTDEIWKDEVVGSFENSFEFMQLTKLFCWAGQRDE